MTSITFETANIADAIRKAARVAPTSRGQAFDMAAGLFMMVDPSEEHPLVIQATNLDIFHTEWVTALHASGPAVSWRLPSMALDRVIGSLPMGPGRTVTFTETGDNRAVEITSGKNLRLRLNGISKHDGYPTWKPFDPDELTEVESLGQQLKRVEWAASAGDSDNVLTGVHLDGRVVLSTDKYRAAMIPCEIEHLDQPVTIPAQTLSALLKDGNSPKLAVIGTMLCVMPDDYTQMKVRTYAHPYPAERLKRALSTDYDGTVEVDRDEMLAVINRVSAIDLMNRTPHVKIWIGLEEIAVFMESSEIGLLRDIVEVPGQATHKRVKYMFNPKNLIDMLSSSPERKIKLGYGLRLTPMIYLSAGEDYQAWAARMVPPSGKDS